LSSTVAPDILGPVELTHDHTDQSSPADCGESEAGDQPADPQLEGRLHEASITAELGALQVILPS
jgi:hypothetical protein